MCCLAGGVFAQSLQPIVLNGPSSNRFNVVFLAEGYTSGQTAVFLADVTNAAQAMFAREPFSEYRSYFNVYAIPVASTQPGSDHPAYGVVRNTYFNSSYDAASDYLITVPPNAIDTNYAHGQGKIDGLLGALMPDCQVSVLLVNDIVPGGSDGFDKTAISYHGAGVGDILLHEMGHVMARLGDEYTNAYPAFPNVEEPNTTRETNGARIKWRAWIAPNTPVPTPANAGYNSEVGLFAGAHYHAAGWYRPKFDCVMNHPGTAAFCEVCSEALALSIYGKVRPIVAASPGALNISVTNENWLGFSVSLQEPATHGLSIQWMTNRVAVAGATNSSFSLLPQMLGNGNSTVEVEVSDWCPFVRSDPSNVLRQTNTWHLAVNLSEPTLRLDSPVMNDAGQFGFRVSGASAGGFVIESSTDLVEWMPVVTNVLADGEWWFREAPGGGYRTRFFRAVRR
jgi:hypothetical protein